MGATAAARARRVAGAAALAVLLGAAAASGSAAGAAPDGAGAERDAGALRAGLVPRAIDLGVPGVRSEATVVSDTGVVAGWYTDEQGDDHAFRWRDGRLELLTSLESSVPTDVNDAGQVALNGSYPSTRTYPFLWEPRGVAGIVYDGDVPATAGGVNAHGVTTWTYITMEDSGHGGFWTPDPPDGELPYQRLFPPGAVSSAVAGRYSVTDRGEVVGRYRDADDRGFAYRWRDGVFTVLPTSDGASASATAVNERGQVLVRVAGTGWMVWEPDGRTRLIAPDDRGFRSTVLNERGVAVGYVGPYGDPTRQRAATADRRGLTLLRGYGDRPSAATAVTDHGVVVGWAARDATAAPHATVWVLGTPFPLGEQVPGATGVASTAHDVNERGRVVGSITTAAATAQTPLRQRAVVWDLVPRR